MVVSQDAARIAKAIDDLGKATVDMRRAIEKQTQHISRVVAKLQPPSTQIFYNENTPDSPEGSKPTSGTLLNEIPVDVEIDWELPHIVGNGFLIKQDDGSFVFQILIDAEHSNRMQKLVDFLDIKHLALSIIEPE